MTRPNLLIVCADQLRADYLGCYGHPRIGTTHIDRLAREGVRFENAYCAAPLSGPSRISFVTSTYVGEHNQRHYGATIDPRIPNLVTSLRHAGYRTAMFGKNHMFRSESLPEVWDEMEEALLGNYDGHPEYTEAWSAFTMETDSPFNMTGKLTDSVIEYMQRTERPFLAWVNYQDPHPAFACPPPYDTLFDRRGVTLPSGFAGNWEGEEPVRNAVWRAHSNMAECDEDAIRKVIATYMGQIRYVDDSVGRLLAALETSGKLENTFILFLSDHGEFLGDRRMTHKGPVFYDCLTRIPVLLRGPGKRWLGRVFDGLVEEVDLTPTLLELLGVSVPPTMVGTSLVKALDEGSNRGRPNILCEAGYGAPTVKEPVEGLRMKAPFGLTAFGPGAMLREGDWKLSIYYDDQCELFNLAEDPEELRNRYDDPACETVKDKMTLTLLKRLLGVKVRHRTGVEWPREAYPVDVRQEPLEQTPTRTPRYCMSLRPHPRDLLGKQR